MGAFLNPFFSQRSITSVRLLATRGKISLVMPRSVRQFLLYFLAALASNNLNELTMQLGVHFNMPKKRCGVLSNRLIVGKSGGREERDSSTERENEKWKCGEYKKKQRLRGRQTKEEQKGYETRCWQSQCWKKVKKKKKGGRDSEGMEGMIRKEVERHG